MSPSIAITFHVVATILHHPSKLSELRDNSHRNAPDLSNAAWQSFESGLQHLETRSCACRARLRPARRSVIKHSRSRAQQPVGNTARLVWLKAELALTGARTRAEDAEGRLYARASIKSSVGQSFDDLLMEMLHRLYLYWAGGWLYRTRATTATVLRARRRLTPTTPRISATFSDGRVLIRSC